MKTLAKIAQITNATKAQIIASVEQSGGAILPQLRADHASAPVIAAVEEAFVGSARRSAFIAAGFVFLGFLASLRLPPNTGERERSE